MLLCNYLLHYFITLLHYFLANSYGMRQTATGVDYAVASESVAIDALDSQFKLARDVAAGEAIFINLKVRVLNVFFFVVELPIIL